MKMQFPLPIKPGDKRHYGELHGASISIVVSEIVKKYNKTILIITPDNLTAQQFQYELQFFLPDNLQLRFPDWETLPYDHFSPHQDIISERLQALCKLPHLTYGIIIVPINTLMYYLPPKAYLEQCSFVLSKGDKLNIEEFRIRLIENGYRLVSKVMEHGEFALRGSLIDLFPMGSKQPFRIDLFDNEVDSIRLFDPENQCSHNTSNHISLLPAHEYPLDKQGITKFRQTWREVFNSNPLECPVYQHISAGESIGGIEYYLPLFFDQLAALFDYLPSDSLIIRLTNIRNKAEQFYQEVTERYEQLRYDKIKPILSPEKICLRVDQLLQRLKSFPQIAIENDTLAKKTYNFNFSTQTLPDINVNYQLSTPLEKLKKFLATYNYKVLFCAESQGRHTILIDLLNKADIKPIFVTCWQEFLTKLKTEGNFFSTVAPIHQGCILQNSTLILITETELFGHQVMQRRFRKRHTQDIDGIVRSLGELNVGDPIVHFDHGVGRYSGLTTLTTSAIEKEYVTIEYEGGDKLYVPVASLNLLTRYSGGNLEHAPLNRLGSKQWEKSKRKAQEKIYDVAAELLDIYAKRALKQGFAFEKSNRDYEKFTNEFPFEETPDQQQAIQKVIEDMTSTKVMDRLICGDVGFGKTEVAMRAAFLAVQSGKQVAILVPTTLLAEQHDHNFQDRFAKWPIKIAALSRFRTSKEQANIIQAIQNGQVDITIGTHKLLQFNIQFKDLGLLIIDEEHRFGVRQKEKIKAIRSHIDILTLTATPIPRTLNMSLTELRDLSIIATPPVRRLSVKTFFSERNNSLLREAIMREILRGGQIYFVHNEVATIERQAEELRKLVPEAKINIAHGQMRERQLENIMNDFYHQRFHILVCSTIVESGIDIPSANTIIINRADRFGLAQLHQLRGRVGRSHHQAYAYLITPSKKSMTKEAKKRLEAFSSLDALGAGFALATHDLEIRGAGELLGEEQSGHIEAIGFSLFMEMLEKTVKALKSGKKLSLEEPLQKTIEIDLHVPTLIPENYMFDVNTRLTFYKRIANAKTETSLKDLKIEMIDRFGLLPIATQNLFTLTKLKLNAEKYDIKKIEAGTHSGRIEFYPNPRINVAALINLIQTYPKQYKLEGNEKLRFTLIDHTLSAKLDSLNEIFQNISFANEDMIIEQ